VLVLLPSIRILTIVAGDNFKATEEVQNMCKKLKIIRFEFVLLLKYTSVYVLEVLCDYILSSIIF
jgi:hypothetical protein